MEVHFYVISPVISLGLAKVLFYFSEFHGILYRFSNQWKHCEPKPEGIFQFSLCPYLGKTPIDASNTGYQLVKYHMLMRK